MTDSCHREDMSELITDTILASYFKLPHCSF
jgi:hypothetical protein